jgi:peptidoglycan/LPS O-acetylase OafA/YrhL
MGENKRIVTGTNYVRAVGIIFVLAYHFFPSLLSGGFFGVDIFFTLSGYLITASIIQAYDDGIFNFGAFIKRRLVRLVPSVLFTVLFTMALTVLISPDFRVGILAQLTAALTFTTNYFEIAQGHSYESQLLPRLFVHTWFLAAQVQLYVIWGLTAAFVYKRFKNKRTALLVCSSVIALFSFIRMQAGVIPEQDNSVVYYDTLARAYPFMIGSVIGALFGFKPGEKAAALMGKRFFKRLVCALGIASAAGIFLLAVYFSFTDTLTYRIGMLGVSVMTAVIIVWLRTINETSRVKEPLPVRFIGVASYSVYLLHWPLFIIVTQLVREHAYGLSLSNRQTVACLVSVLCTLPLAWLSYKYVENIPRGTQRMKRIALTLGSFMLAPSVFAVAGAPEITSIEESFLYMPEQEAVPVFVVSAAENDATPAPIVSEPPSVKPPHTEKPFMPTPTDTPVTDATPPPAVEPTAAPSEEPIAIIEPEAGPTEAPAADTPPPADEPSAAPTQEPAENDEPEAKPSETPVTEVSEETPAPVIEAEPTETPAAVVSSETPAPVSVTEPPKAQVVADSSQLLIGMPTPTPAPVRPINSEFIDVKYEGLTIDGGVLILGDSVTLGASQVMYPLFNYVTDNNWTFEAKVSRNMKNGLNIINEYIAEGKLSNYKYIVLALASNIQNSTYKSIEELIKILGGDYEVIFVTGYGRDFMVEPAEYLRTLPGLYENISVADWEKSIEPYTKELAPDGLHAGTTLSRKIYSECILDTIIKIMDERTEEQPSEEPAAKREVIF